MDTDNFSVYFLFYPNIKLTLEKTNFSNSLMRKPQPLTIPCPFFVGRVKRQRNPTHLLGFVLQPNLQIKTFFNLDKVLIDIFYLWLIPNSKSEV